MKTFLYKDFLFSLISDKEAKVVQYKGDKCHVTIPSFVTLKDGTRIAVTTIAPSCFFSNSNIELVSFGKNIKTVMSQAFSECPNLKAIQLNDKLKVIQPDAFSKNITAFLISSKNKNFKYENYILVDVNNGSLLYYCSGHHVSSYAIPYGIKSIETSAFFASNDLHSIIIPESVERIELGAFALCDNLENVTVNGLTTELDDSCFVICNNLDTFYYKKGSMAEKWVHQNLMLFDNYVIIRSKLEEFLLAHPCT